MKNSIATVLLLALCYFRGMEASESDRDKRSYSIYPFFGSSSPLTHDPIAEFIHFLGGHLSNRRSDSGYQVYDSRPILHDNQGGIYPIPVQALVPSDPTGRHGPGSSRSSTVFDDSLSNLHAVSSNILEPAVSVGRTLQPQPSLSSFNSGSFYTPHHDYSTPNFANYDPASVGSYTPVHPLPVPSLDVHSVAQAARSTFQAHNDLFDALLEGLTPQQPHKEAFSSYF